MLRRRCRHRKRRRGTLQRKTDTKEYQREKLSQEEESVRDSMPKKKMMVMAMMMMMLQPSSSGLIQHEWITCVSSYPSSLLARHPLLFSTLKMSKIVPHSPCYADNNNVCLRKTFER